MAAVAVSRTPAAHAATIARMQVALGQSLLRAGQTAEAVDVLAQAIARGFHGGSAYLAYSRALHREGQTDAARLAADQAIVAAPGNEAARNWRASLGEANNR